MLASKPSGWGASASAAISSTWCSGAAPTPGSPTISSIRGHDQYPEGSAMVVADSLGPVGSLQVDAVEAPPVLRGDAVRAPARHVGVPPLLAARQRKSRLVDQPGCHLSAVHPQQCAAGPDAPGAV